MSKKRIIITGVAGFIGSTLAKKLCELGKNVIGIDNLLCGYEKNLHWVSSEHKFKFYNMDISDIRVKDILEKDDIVVHLAAVTVLPINQNDPEFSYKNNVISTVSLLEACRLKGISHFIFASSCCVYENTKIENNTPITEESELKPNLIYSLSKKHCEELINSYYDNYGLNYTIFRFFNVYGTGADDSRLQTGLIPYIIRENKNKNTINLYGDGEQSRDYIFIDDLISLLVKSIEMGSKNTVINASSGKAYSVNKILKIIQDELNVSITPNYLNPSSLWDKFSYLFSGEFTFNKKNIEKEALKFTLGDTQKANNLLNWKAETSLEKGINILIKNIR